MKSIRSLNPAWLVLVSAFAIVAVYATAYGFGYGAGKDAALRDNRADAARAAQQNVEG